MPEPLKLTLSSEQRGCLEEARKKHPKPYVRERAFAVLLVARGRSARSVAALLSRSLDAVRRWVHGYRDGGIAGLLIRPGRGRKPAFSPSVRE